MKTTNFDDKVYVEVGRGYRQRRIASVPFILADARTNMTAPNHVLADGIPGETSFNKAIMVAPCNGEILKVSVNAAAFPVNGGAAGTITADVYKAVIGAANLSVLSATISLENSTAETAVHGTVLSTNASTFIEGQLIYAQIAISADAITTRSNGAEVTIEWRPTEA